MRILARHDTGKYLLRMGIYFASAARPLRGSRAAAYKYPCAEVFYEWWRTAKAHGYLIGAFLIICSKFTGRHVSVAAVRSSRIKRSIEVHTHTFIGVYVYFNHTFM